MNSVCKIKVIFKFFLIRKGNPMCIKPQQRFKEAGVKTRSSLSVCQ